MSQATVLARIFMTIELVLLYGECRVGQQPRYLQRYMLDASLLAAGLLTVRIKSKRQIHQAKKAVPMKVDRLISVKKYFTKTIFVLYLRWAVKQYTAGSRVSN